jgi:hypothetical protein
MNARMESLGITPQLLLEVFDIPVSFHRCLVPITGGVTSALMLSQAIWTSQSLEPSADGWFLRSRNSGHRRPGSRAGSRRPRAARCAARACSKNVALACRRSSGSASARDAVWRALQAHAGAADR